MTGTRAAPAPPAVPGGKPSVAILVVDGFRRRGRWGRENREQALKYPWIELCLRQVARHTQGWDYRVFVYDNTHLASHRAAMARYPLVQVLPAAPVAVLGRTLERAPAGQQLARPLERSHPGALDWLARRVAGSFDYIVTLDNDSFPVRADWLEVLVGGCEAGASLAGVYRDEMAPEIDPFIHVSGLCVRARELLELGASFGRDASPEQEHNQDVGQRITYELTRRGRPLAPLRRSNALNYHFLLGGVYGDVIYHHGAGSRKGKFWTSTDRDGDERVNAALRAAAFDDLDRLLAVLRGQADNHLEIEPL
ncbi:MAG TPA: hypothetical protein VL979_02975 [Solirubrobacteraceae bacterium]|nr:hypothetical protein [Solirubrobacteraceae bacterium]